MHAASVAGLFAIIWLSFQVGVASNEVVAIWPAAGLGVWLALRYGWYALPTCFLGQFSYSMLFQSDYLVAFLISTFGNAFAICFATSLYRRLGGPADPLSCLRGATLLIVVLAVLHSALAAAVGTSAVTLSFELDAVGRWEVAWRWFFSDFTGVVLMTPLFIALFDHLPAWRKNPSLTKTRRLLRSVAVTAAVIGLLILASRLMPDALGEYPIVLLTMPASIWLAFQRDAVSGIGLLVVTVIAALWLTLDSVGDASTQSFLAVQLYGVVVMCTGLVLHAVSHERRVAIRQLAEQREQLEEAVALRTRELSEQVAAYARIRDELERQATTDSLTGLANRRAFMEHALREFAAVQRTGDPMCLVMIDLDHFKSINDTYGHSIGDEVLARVGEILSGAGRQGLDIPARIGGEEFACLLSHTRLNDAVTVATRILQQFRAARVATSAGPLSFTASFGIAEVNSLLPDFDHALVAADEALYDAKREGRDRVCTHDATTVTIAMKVASQSAG